MTLGDLEGHLPIAILQLTACSRGPSEVAAASFVFEHDGCPLLYLVDSYAVIYNTYFT